MGGGVPGTQASTGKYGGMANQGGGANPFQQFQGMGVQQAGQQPLGVPQTQQQYQPQQYQQQPMQPFQGQQPMQRPFQAQQPNYAALFNSLAGMFGGQQGGGPRSNYNPVRSANNFQLQRTYQFDPATDPSRQYAAKMQAERDRKAAEDAAKAAAAVPQDTYVDPGSPGNARGGRISGPDKQIRKALMTAKGVQARAMPEKAGGGDVTSGDNFKGWFGSSVAHEDGVPTRFYHGTSKDKDFTSFNMGRHGVWLTADPKEASMYAQENDSQGHVYEDGKFTPTNTASRVMPVYLKAENPYTGERPEHIVNANNYKKAQSDWFDQLRSAGYDSWIPESANGKLAVALKHPTQIKSAVSNTGKFSSTDKHIGKMEGGALAAPGAPAPEEEDSITAYHGSPHSFEEFDPEEVHWFAKDEKTARLFGKSRMKVPLNSPKNPVMYEVKINGKLQTRDPMAEATEIAKQINENPPSNWDEVGNILQWPQYQRDVLDEAHQSGFDGVRFVNVGDVPGNAGGEGYDTHYAITNPKVIQIKRRYATGGGALAAPGAPALPKRVTDSRISELQDAADMVAAGHMGPEEYHAQVGNLKPVRPYTSLPPMATREDLLRGLSKDKHAKIGAEEAIPEGHAVGLRLDIPAYRLHGVWAPTIHEGHEQNSKPIAHAPFARVSNPVFSVNANKALGVARGNEKAPFAKINGFWKKTSPEDAQAMAQEYLTHPEWRQVGMDPERHSFFYDRETRQPVVSADEALQIGPLVLAKNPKYGSLKDFQYEKGGRVGYAGGGGEDDPTVQKALGLTQQAQPNPVQMARRLNDQGLYSHAAEAAAALPQAKGSPQQMKATLKGVKQEELAGFDEAFGGRPSVTRDEMAQHFNDRMPQIETKVLAGEGSDGARFSGEVLPGGTNYREMLLKLPNQDEATKPFQSSHWEDPNVLAHLRMSDRIGPNGEKVLHVEEIQSDWGQKGRQEGFVDPVAHRKHKEAKDKMNAAYKSFNDLVNNFPLPESVLALNAPFRPGEETPRQYERRQEDFQEARLEFLRHTPEWQASRKQYSDARDEFHNLGEPPSSKGVPTGPYVTNTQAWTDLALKAALKEAAHGNYDRVAWTNGQDQAERYDLSKHLDSVHYNPGTQTLYAFDKRGRQVLEEDAEPHEIEKHIGKDLAQKLLADTPDLHSTMNEHDIERDPESGKWNIYLYGEPVHEYGGNLLEFDSKGHARDHLREMVEESLQNHTSVLKNVDLVVGGEGMKSYYDKIVPNRIMDVAKKAGAPVKVEPHKIDTAEGEKTLHSIRMTPELRASVMRGLPAYKDGGRAGYNVSNSKNNSTVRRALDLTKGMN